MFACTYCINRFNETNLPKPPSTAIVFAGDSSVSTTGRFSPFVRFLLNNKLSFGFPCESLILDDLILNQRNAHSN